MNGFSNDLDEHTLKELDHGVKYIRGNRIESNQQKIFFRFWVRVTENVEEIVSMSNVVFSI